MIYSQRCQGSEADTATASSPFRAELYYVRWGEAAKATEIAADLYWWTYPLPPVDPFGCSPCIHTCDINRTNVACENMSKGR